MKSISSRIYLLFISIWMMSADVISQENHYWATQFGPTSSFLSGAVTGGVRDNSLLFYNPGAAAFTKEFNLSLQSDAIYNQNIYVKNGAGEGINVHHNSFESSPQLFAFTFGSKKRPSWRTSIGWLTTAYSNIRMRARNEVLQEIDNNSPGKEVYIGSWNYRNRTREDWYGIAVTKKINEKLGIGISTFITMRSYEYSEYTDQNLLSTKNGNEIDYESINYLVKSDNMDGAASGLLLKIGIAYEFKDYKLGLTVTTPRAQVNFLSSMSASSSFYSTSTSGDSTNELPGNYTVLYDGAQSTFKSPWIVDFGFMKNFFETDVYVRIGYFSAVKAYQLVTPEEISDISTGLYQAGNDAGTLKMAQKEIWNIAIGWNRKLTEKFGLMAGFRTDFNYIDKEAIENVNGFSPEISYWNLYHVSAGSKVNILKHNFTLGLTYSFGKAFGQEQFVNLGVPDFSVNPGPREVENTADAHIDQLALTIGYVYNFN